MECKKYEIIKDGGRNRIRSLRDFTVQDRHVCIGDLGGYVYDDKTLDQNCPAWIFSGSLEYPGVRVMDEAIVDMGNNLSKVATRPKATIISGNSRIMGAISFETQPFNVAQTPAMFEQGGYTAKGGTTPVKASDGSRIRIAAALFGGSTGKVAITSASYQARIISLDSDGLVMNGGAWAAGGPTVTLTTASPYFLVEVRKTAGTAITPADVTAAEVTITLAGDATVRIFNSSIVPVYNGSVTTAANILRYETTYPIGNPYQEDIQNSYLRIECSFDASNNVVRANADFIRVNYNLVLTPNVAHFIVGTYRNTNINTPASVNKSGYNKLRFDVSDCPNFEFSTVTFPDLTAMYASGKTFYFKNCNMPVGSAIHYYDPKVNVWDNIDFTKAMADLGKTAFVNTTIVSSNVQGMYRARGNTNGVMGGLLEAASSFDGATCSGVLGDTYDSIIYKDCVLKGVFTIIGCNVFGGTLGGASKITNTVEKAMEINGSFRIEGNAQVTDTPLKGNGYIGGNAELKNGNVLGYIYMDGDSKVILPVNTSNFRRLIMRDNARVMKVRASTALALEMYGNALLNGELATGGGQFIMRDNSVIDSSGLVNINGGAEMRDNASITGTSNTTVSGDVVFVGNYKQISGLCSFYGKRVISDASQIAVVDAPPTKITW